MSTLTQPSPPSLLWGGDSLNVSADGTSWLWYGYLARGGLTLLTSQWKSGKTTLVSVLLARLETGGEFAGLSLAAGKAVVLSEEGPYHWQSRHRRLHFGDHVGWFCRPFRGKPRSEDWIALLDHVADLHAARGLSLIVIDPLAGFLPGKSENDASAVLDALMPLQRLTTLGLAVLVLHHPRKEETEPGQAARGSGALSGYADILIEMRHCPRASDDDRCRRLHAFSRFPDTPRQRVIELTSDATDYVSHGSFLEAEFAGHWQILSPIFESAPYKLTRSELLRSWPNDRRPERTVLNVWLERAVAQGLLRQDGRGRRGHPFRYWLPAREEAWRHDLLARLHMPELTQDPSPTPEKATF
jgi:hypothetical protein